VELLLDLSLDPDFSLELEPEPELSLDPDFSLEPDSLVEDPLVAAADFLFASRLSVR
jgi:hypothetical protein